MKETLRILVVFVFILYFITSDWIQGDLTSLKSMFPNFYWLIYLYNNYIFYVHSIIVVFILYSKVNLFFGRHKIQLFKFLNERGISTSQFIAHLNQSVFNNYKIISFVFLKSLSFIYLIAFGSFIWQISLVTQGGIISFDSFYRKMILQGYDVVFNYPSIFWINQSDKFIWIVVLIGIYAAFHNLIFKPLFTFQFIQWFFYLSIISFGRDLYHFPWDTFLSEVGFLSVFLVYFITNKQFPNVLLFAFRLLFFRQWFSMGMTKIILGSQYWSDYTFLKLFWLNQPSPTPFATFLFNLPLFFQKSSTIICLILEFLIPFLMFFGKKARIVAFFFSTLLSLLIELNGNYGFFNILTITLGLFCLNDHFFGKIKFSNLNTVSSNTVKNTFFLFPILVVIFFNLFYVLLQFTKQSNHPLNYTNYYFVDKKNNQESKVTPIFFVGKLISNFRIVSPHGVFKYIPNQRLHLQIQVKYVNDTLWKDLKFKKGKDVKDLSFVAPNMNRVAYYLYYQAYGIELRKLLKININSSILPSTMFEIMKSIQTEKKSIFYVKNKVSNVRIIHNILKPSKGKWISIPIDTIYFNPLDSMYLPVKTNSNYFLKK